MSPVRGWVHASDVWLDHLLESARLRRWRPEKPQWKNLRWCEDRGKCWSVDGRTLSAVQGNRPASRYRLIRLGGNLLVRDARFTVGWDSFRGEARPPANGLEWLTMDQSTFLKRLYAIVAGSACVLMVLVWVFIKGGLSPRGFSVAALIWWVAMFASLFPLVSPSSYRGSDGRRYRFKPDQIASGVP